jgi:hypothetical protein
MPASTSDEEKRRVHILVFSSDWEKLKQIYPDSVKLSSVMRTMLRDYVKRIEARRDQRL